MPCLNGLVSDLPLNATGKAMDTCRAFRERGERPCAATCQEPSRASRSDTPATA